MNELEISEYIDSINFYFDEVNNHHEIFQPNSFRYKPCLKIKGTYSMFHENDSSNFIKLMIEIGNGELNVYINFFYLSPDIRSKYNPKQLWEHVCEVINLIDNSEYDLPNFYITSNQKGDGDTHRLSYSSRTQKYTVQKNK